MEERCTAASIDSTEGKFQSKEDRISCLPDALIQYILSLLPSTKEAVRTGVLSKRWLNQWTRVPVLVFSLTDIYDDGNYSRFVDDTLILHDCPKIVKFHLDSNSCDWSWLAARIRFATARDVEELVLNWNAYELFTLPEFFYNNASLVKLETSNCNFNGKANWKSLKALKIINAGFSKQSIQDVLSGCPVLGSLELVDCYGLLGIASKSLKALTFCCQNTDNSNIEISCPNLEELNLFSCLGDGVFKFVDFPSSVCVRLLDWEDCIYNPKIRRQNLAKDTLLKLRHVKELKLGNSFIKILSNSEVGALSSSSLTLHYPDDFHGVSNALHNSPLLEKLVLKLKPRVSNHKSRVTYDLCDLNDFEESYWNSNKFLFNNLIPRLKTFKIIGLCERADVCKSVLHFIEFLLRNTRALQKMFIIFHDPWIRKDFVSLVSQKLTSIQRGSPHAIVELYILYHDRYIYVETI